MKPLQTTAVALLGVALAFGACGDDDAGDAASATTDTTAAADATDGGAPATGDEIDIPGFEFAPPSLTVAAGTEITVANTHNQAHTLTARDSGAFQTGSIAAGASSTISAPADAGTYEYFCSFHPFMKGELIVE